MCVTDLLGPILFKHFILKHWPATIDMHLATNTPVFSPGFQNIDTDFGLFRFTLHFTYIVRTFPYAFLANIGCHKVMCFGAS
ncbi:hypothetical protein, partial [Acinetobacter indicus]|uniref:hypothetical protein n=1 Tax=Acinetobacter indicus TaxID=756892 RepID=UPI001BB469B9